MIILYGDDEFPQGKYRGIKVQKVAQLDPKYLDIYEQQYVNFGISDEVRNAGISENIE